MAVKPLPLIAESGHQDANQNFSVVGVQGTLGTSDTAGTAPTVAFSGDPTTGAQYVYNLGPAGSVSLGNITGGTINRIGSIDTIGTMPAISLALNTGTITTIAAGTQNTLGTVGTIPGIGTVTNIGSISTIGTMPAVSLALNTGTITTIAAGTQNTLGTVGVVNAGTINAIAAGTITAGTLTNLVSGTINALAAGTITTGTIVNNGGSVQVTDNTNSANILNGAAGTAVGQNALLTGGAYLVVPATSVTSATTIFTQDAGNYSFVSLNITAIGTATVSFEASNDNFVTTAVPINLNQPNITSGGQGNTTTSTGGYEGGIGFRYFRARVSAFTAGTITASATFKANAPSQLHGGVAAVQSGAWNVTGTVATGTIQQNFIPVVSQSTFGTIGTTGATIFGTLAGGTGSGAGTEIFITSLSLTIPSTAGSQDVSIGWGTNAGTFHAGTGRLIRGNFPAGGGIQKEFNPAINSGTNAQLAYFQAGAGTVEIDITYFITPSTI